MKPIRVRAVWVVLVCAGWLPIDAFADILPAAYECVSDLLETTPSSDFTAFEGGAVVRHEPTGLEWRRCAEGMTWTGTTCTGSVMTMTWQGALQHADAETGWRLPNVRELRSIIERCRASPAVNRHVFPATPVSFFWSASPYIRDSDRAWVVEFNLGMEGTGGKGANFHVRLVRDAQ